METLVDASDGVKCVRREAFEYTLQDLGDAKGFVAWFVVWRLLVLEWNCVARFTDFIGGHTLPNFCQ